METALYDFINSWYFVTIFLGTIFLVLVRDSLKKLVDKIRFSFKKEDLDVSTSPAEESQEKAGKEELKKMKDFLKEIGAIDFDGFKQSFLKLLEGLEGQKKKMKEAEDKTNALFKLVTLYDFKYLDLYLVFNSKTALLWFYNLRSKPVTKEFFLLSFELPPTLEKQSLEKEAIFSVLVSENLIEKSGKGLCQITQKGIDFLRFIGFLKAS